jgi:hypothetical protein
MTEQAQTMTVADLREALRDKPDHLPVYLWCCSGDELTTVEVTERYIIGPIVHLSGGG